MPEVSVIIPNFNHGAYLKERIDSVLNQTFQDLEVIILDDCSLDNSRDIIEAYRSHAKVTAIVYNEKNSGSTFKQWNKGVGLASGKFIWIAESDDVAADGFLNNLLNLYRQNAMVGIAYCQSYRIDEKSTVTGDWLQHTDIFNNSMWLDSFCMRGAEVIENYLGFINILPNASALLINRESYLKAGGADERFILNGDWYLWIKILMEGYSIAYSPKRNNYFREHSVKVTRAAIKKGLNISEAYAILEYIFAQKEVSYQGKTKLFNFYKKYYLPGIFNKSVPIKVLAKSLKSSFTLSFYPTFKFILSMLPKIVMHRIKGY